MKQPHITKPAVCAMLSLFMHGALGAWIVHAIQPTHQNWQPIRPIQVSLVSEFLDPASGNETGQIDQNSEVAPGLANTSSDFESAPIQEAEIEQKTDPIKPGAESEDIQEVRRSEESDAYQPDLPRLETSVSESTEYTQIRDDAVEPMTVTPVAKSPEPVETEPQILSVRYPDNDEFDMNSWQSTATMIDESVSENSDISNPIQQDIQQESIDLDNSRAVWTELETNEANPVELLQVVALTTEFNTEQVQTESVEITDLDAERAVWNEFESEITNHSESPLLTGSTMSSTTEDVTIDMENWLNDADQYSGTYFEPEDYRDLTQPITVRRQEIEMAVSIDELVSFQPFEKSIDPVETEPQILSTRYADYDEFDMNSWQSNATMIDEFMSENSDISEPVQQDIQQESIDLDNSRAVWTEPETNEAIPVELLQVVALTTEFNVEQVQTESVEITDLDAERAAWNELESEITSHSESLQFTVLTVNTTAEDMTIDTENWLDNADQLSGMYFEPEDYRNLTPPISIQEPAIEMAASIELVSQQPEEHKESAETQIKVENSATLSDFELEAAHLNFPDTEQNEFIAFNPPDSVLEVPETEQFDQLDLNENVGIEGQLKNKKIASLEQKQQQELINIEKLQGSKASTSEQSVAQSTGARKVAQPVAQAKPILENDIASPTKDGTRKEETPKQYAALNHSKQQNGEPKNRDQLNDHLQTANLGAASLPMSSQPRFGVEGLSNPAPRYPYLSRSREEEGKVILQVYINKKGRVSRIETIQSSGHSRLDKAARKAVKNWTFIPALEDGNPTAGVVQVPILFVLKN